MHLSGKPYSWRGGIHPLAKEHYGKEMGGSALITPAPVPDVVIIPMVQHIGAPCQCIVAKGDPVKLGQVVGQSGGFVSAPVHSSVSGRVLSVEPRLTVSGQMAVSAVIENDGEDTPREGMVPGPGVDGLSAQELKNIIRDSGIVGMGGAAFPTHVKLSPPEGTQIDTLIVNGAECEPYLTADHRLMMERPEDVLYGTRVLMKILGVSHAVIAIEDNKDDAYVNLKRCAAGTPGIEVIKLKTKFPQGSEKQLIYSVTKKQVPSGGLPMAVGVVVHNVATAAAVAQAVRDGIPLYQRVVSVTGPGVVKPRNLLARIGTPVEFLIEASGGLRPNVNKVLSGGPMMGVALYDLSVPIVKGTGGIVALEAAAGEIENPCIRCGRCVSACPIGLLPLYVHDAVRMRDFVKAEAYGALDCIECGSCTYACPARRQLTQSCRVAKRQIVSARRQKS